MIDSGNRFNLVVAKYYAILYDIKLRRTVNETRVQLSLSGFARHNHELPSTQCACADHVTPPGRAGTGRCTRVAAQMNRHKRRRERINTD